MSAADPTPAPPEPSAPSDEVAAAIRRTLVGWARRYASVALLVTILGVVIAVAPSRSPVQALFDSSGFSDTGSTSPDPAPVATTTPAVPSTTPAVVTTVTTTSDPATTLATIADLPPETTPAADAPSTEPTTTDAPTTTSTTRPPTTTTSTTKPCTVGAAGICAAP